LRLGVFGLFGCVLFFAPQPFPLTSVKNYIISFYLVIAFILFADLNNELLKAARKGNLDKVISLILKGADINTDYYLG